MGADSRRGTGFSFGSRRMTIDTLDRPSQQKSSRPRKISLPLQPLGVGIVERLPAEAHGVLTDDRPDRMSIEETFGDDEADVPAGRYFRHHGGVVGGLVQGQPRAERARFEFPSKDVVAPRVFEQRRWFGARHMCDEL